MHVCTYICVYVHMCIWFCLYVRVYACVHIFDLWRNQPWSLPSLFYSVFIRSWKFSTKLSFFRRIRQVQYTKSCHNFSTINSDLIVISTVPGGTVQAKIFSTNKKGFGTDSNVLHNTLVGPFIFFYCTGSGR